MCIDFRRLNKVTKKDPYQLPRVDALTDRMQGCSYFSSIDVFSAFWNVPMADEDIEKTGFSTFLRQLRVDTHALWARDCLEHVTTSHGLSSSWTRRNCSIH